MTQCVLVENLPAEPGWVAFDATGTLAAVASERDVKVFVIERKEVLVMLEGHLARVRVHASLGRCSEVRRHN